MTATLTPVDTRPAQAGPAPRTSRLWAVGGTLAILGALLLGFVAEVGPLGGLRHERDLRVGYADLRAALAGATAPIGPDTEPGTPVALLTIPQLGVREVVREGSSAEVLASGPGHRRDTVLPGQAGTSIVMGRRAGYGGPFAHLASLQIGETVEVTTGQGTHKYRVTGVRRAGDPQPPAMQPGTGRLTLMTATGSAFRPDGLLQVDAELITPPQPGAVPAFRFGRVPADELPLAGQPSSWLPAVLWSQALLLAAGVLVWARSRVSRTHVWLVGLPVLLALGLTVGDQVALLLPNLL
ncbi:sortase domain-bontaining protein [Streptomyces sp. NPDC015661]|uniref:sortase domain-containing protein n=1 Tax=Streptomyces sp. NPDC015661 TaxID=3364961 RepID=UPI00370236B5